MATHALVPVLAGGGAGLVETVLTYPLDLVKTRQQATGTSRLSVPQTLLTVWREGGGSPLGFYRGLSAPIMSEVPRRAFKFGGNSLLQRILRENFGLAGVSAAVLSGAGAGASETIVHTPFERIKILSQSGQYRSPWEALKAVCITEGVFNGLYRGFVSYVLRQATWNGAFFGFIHAGKQMLTSGDITTPLGTRESFCIGLVSGSLATCLNNPLDVAKTRIQNFSMGSAYKCRSTTNVLIQLIATEGIHSLLRGLPARLYRSAPGHGVLFMAYNELENRIGKVFHADKR